MSTFEQLSKMPGVGVLYYFDISIDGGATYTRNYSTQWWSRPGGGFLESEPRIASLGNLSRRLGADRGFTASTIDVVIENTDGGADWLCDQDTYASEAVKSLWRLACYLWNPADPTDGDVKYLGKFSLMRQPTRNSTTISASLIDGGVVSLAQLATPPSIRDWVNIIDADRPSQLTAVNLGNPIAGSIPDFDYDAPVPLMFGTNVMPIRRVFQNCYIICAVPGTKGTLPETIDKLHVGTLDVIPRQVVQLPLGTLATMWTVHRTPDIVKNGKTWHLLWIDIDVNDDATAAPYFGSGTDQTFRNLIRGIYGDAVKNNPLDGYSAHDVIAPVSVEGCLFSHKTNDLGTPANISAVTVATDLLQYCTVSAPTIIGASEALALRSSDFASGILTRGTQESFNVTGARIFEFVDGEMPAALRSLCAVGRFDVFSDWDGNVKFAVMGADYASQSGTIETLPEWEMGDTAERVPDIGERNTPSNRTYVRMSGRRFGPIDDEASITAWGRVIPREIDGAWLPNGNLVDRFWLLTAKNGRFQQNPPDLTRFKGDDTSTPRPTLSTVTSLNGLNFDLADYVKVTWTRGTIGGPYLDAIFRVEGIALAPLDGKVQLELVWCDDLRAPGSLPYILDDEDEALVVTASGGRTCTLTDGSITVEFSSGDLSADGVALGDVLVVRDAGESATAFKRNRTLIIVNIIDADTLEVDVTDFGSGGPFTISDWKIVHGPDNNPRPDYYGSTCTVLGQFYNLGEANRLLDG